MTLAVETDNLTKIYEKTAGWRRQSKPVGASANAVQAVAGINLAVPEGELFGLLGPNGAGKTTLTKMLCTLILPTAGSGQIGGYGLEQAGAIRGAVGLVVSNERSFYWRLSARRNLLFFAALHGLFGKAAETRVDEALADVDLRTVAERRFSDLSSGMQQRLAIARSLLHQPSILFLDEPSRSLDPTATLQLHELIRSLMARQNLTVFLITHDLAEAEKLCGRVALMHQGRIQTIGRPADLRRQLKPQRHYVLQVDRLETAVSTALRSHFPAISVNPERHEVSFWGSEQDGLITAVIDLLRAQQATIHTITAAPPSLEEVFAHHTGKAEGKKQKAEA
ncbi:MAG: ABC transporter ATP-binding protein [Chloroflexota bacterium]